MNLTIKSDGYVNHNQKPNKGKQVYLLKYTPKNIFKSILLGLSIF